MPARDLLGEGSPLATALPGYEARPEQMLMADAVESALDGGTGALIEAGTGTGKSLAYLVPAAMSSLRVVISTATKALGEQLMEKDIPTLKRLGLHPDVTLVKGLSNYVCRRRLEEYRQGVATGAMAPEYGLDRVLDWVEDTATGDRSELPSLAEDAAVWREVVSSSETRIGPKCRFYEQCFVTRMRRSAEASQVIVTNHHMFCADLALRGGYSGAQALPDHDAVIFDEAHALEDVATEFFGVRLTRSRVDALARDADRALRTSGFFVDPSRERSIQHSLNAMSAGALRIFASIPRGAGRVTLNPRDLSDELLAGAAQLLAGLEELEAHVRDFVGTNDMVLSVARRARSMKDSVRIIMKLDEDKADAFVTFSEAEARGGGAIGASPVEIGPLLTERLWSRRGAVILTSATLSAGGDFSFIRQRLGVPAEASDLTLPSPFDFGAQAGLYVPRRIPEPRDPGYLDAACEEIRRLVALTRGGAFILCTSVRMMRAFRDALRGEWSHPTWMQGEAPKRVLLERFRASGDAVLFATSSFWEGVDVPGRALRLVVIDKLPFDAPNDPVTAARIARLQQQGRDPFADYQVPVAALALKQGFGRLIRTRRDAGIVAILDRRLLTRAYGRTLLDSLPPASRLATLDEAKAFWEMVRHETPAARVDEAAMTPAK